jgi:hypothetical protein
VLHLVLAHGARANATVGTIRSVYEGTLGKHNDEKATIYDLAARFKKNEESHWTAHFFKTGKWEQPPFDPNIRPEAEPQRTD